MGVLVADERRRITLPKDMVEEGQRFVAIKVRGEIILKPLPRDPIAAMQKEGEKIPKDMSVADLRKIALEEATKEALGNLERLEKLKKPEKRKR